MLPLQGAGVMRSIPGQETSSLISSCGQKRTNSARKDQKMDIELGKSLPHE